LTYFSKNSQTTNLTKFHPEGAKLPHTDRRTDRHVDRHDEAHSRFWQFSKSV